MQSSIKPTLLSLSASQIEDLKLASSKMSGAERRAFQATMTLKYCRGNARLAERIFGWGRDTVQLGLNEQRTGVICQGAQAACSGDKLWEENHPEVAQALWALAELHSQQDRPSGHCCRTPA